MTISLALSDELLDEIDALAVEGERSRAGEIRVALREYVQRKQQDQVVSQPKKAQRPSVGKR